MSKDIIQLNEEVVKSELKELVRKSVEETLNELLDKEADELTSAAKYERTKARQGYRSGHYSRKLTTTSGEVRLAVPKLKGVPFETAIIERYRRRETVIRAKMSMPEIIFRIWRGAPEERQYTERVKWDDGA